MDYEAAFQRERLARKKAEKFLEEKSRELYFTNEELRENIKSQNATLLQNSILLSVNRYGVEKEKLRNFFPGLIRDMLQLVEMPFGLFEHYSLGRNSQRYRSDIIVNHDLPAAKDSPDTLQEPAIDELVASLSGQVMEKKQLIMIDNVLSSLDESKTGILSTLNINFIIALPVISLESVAGIIYLCSDSISDEQDKIIHLYEGALKQLGMLVEHRYQEEKIKESYEELQVTNNALQTAQSQLVQSEKMASVGQLSAGIAHEINNPMGFIKSNIATLCDYVTDFEQYILLSKKLVELAGASSNDNLKVNAEEIEALSESIDLEFLLEDSASLLDESKHGIKRVIDIVSGLKRFARQSDNNKEPCNIRDNIEEALKLAHGELKYSVNVSSSFEDTSLVMVNGGEMTQVFLNMFINAGHAIKENGDIKVSTEDFNEGVKILISDNGCGMEQSVIDHIFDPFFTTKDVGVGTGLGLSISYGIIQDHGGDITVESVVGEGTTFIIWVPIGELDAGDSAAIA